MAKYWFNVIILFGLASSWNLSASNNRLPKVVYGDDNRQLIHLYPNNTVRNWAKSTAAMIEKVNLRENVGGKIFISNPSTLRTVFNVCSDELFANELSTAICSGFLVAPNLLLTAGHCINSASDCRTARWVFDYRADQVNSKTPYVLEKNVYKCQSIVTSAYDKNKDLDYSLIQLDRSVTDRSPLPIRKEGKLSETDELVVIGHPSGLPTIIADQGFAYKNDQEKIFGANLDTFSINSGSAVLNKVSGEIEGILIRGQMDYILDRHESCLRPNFWRQDKYPGETITRITSIPGLSQYLLLK